MREFTIIFKDSSRVKVIAAGFDRDVDPCLENACYWFFREIHPALSKKHGTDNIVASAPMSAVFCVVENEHWIVS